MASMRVELDMMHLDNRWRCRLEPSWVSDLHADPDFLYPSVCLQGEPLDMPPNHGGNRRASTLVPPRPVSAAEIGLQSARSWKPLRSADHRHPPTTGARARVKYALCVNLGGDRYRIKETTLVRAAGTLLAELTPDHPAYDRIGDEYFFDRSAGFFPFLLDHFDGGVLHFPHCLCPQNLLCELQFWKVPADILPACCNTIISDYLAEQVTLGLLEKALIKKNPYDDKQRGEVSRVEKMRANVYNFLEYPDSSIHARVWVVAYTMMVLLSIAIACLASVPEIREPTDATHCAQYINTTKKYNTCATVMPEYMWYTSTILNFIFFIEICVKLYVYPHSKYKFFTNFLNDMDIIAVVLTMSTNFIQRFLPAYWQDHIQSMTSLSAIASVLKVGRMTQFVKHNRGLRVLVLTLKFSRGDLSVLLFLMVITMLLYSVAIYIAEYAVEDMFMNIPEGMWWSLVTMTTVGYNDMRPSTLFGYIIGCICAMIGVVITGAAIPLTANSFEKLTALSRLVDTRR